jgi:hypothetical protein
MSMTCQTCGVEAPTRYVAFYQNIGALLMRFQKSIKGHMCKRCIHTHFWPMTMTTVCVGWLGVHSAIIAPFFVLNNLIRYLICLPMPAVPERALPPEVNQQVLAKFMPEAKAAFDRINAGEKLEAVSQAIAPKLGMTPGQVALCMITIARHAQSQGA